MKPGIGYQRPLSPVRVEIGAPVLCRATVHASDLEDQFGERVHIQDAGEGNRTAEFDPPLGAEDIWLIARLSESYHRQRIARLRKEPREKAWADMIQMPDQKFRLN